jgi:peptidoglycan L-alanyl-D-glutamate endopeptidase CwlK
MAFTLVGRSIHNLAGVHPDLVRVVLRAAEGPTSFIVTEGLRTLERQKVLMAEGKSRTLRSRHLTGHAVDLAVLSPEGISWDKGDYKMLSMQVKAAALELAIPLEWGGEAFGTAFYDGCHWQLPWKFYPAQVPDITQPNEQPSVAQSSDPGSSFPHV